MSGHMKEDTFKCKACNALYSIVWEEEVSIKFCPVCGEPAPSDEIPGTPCRVCHKPTDHPYDGADVYHAECLKKAFPNSTMCREFSVREEGTIKGVFVGPPLQCNRCGCVSFRLEDGRNLCNRCDLEVEDVAGSR